MLELTQWQFLKHIIFRPFEGYEDLRWKKSGSMAISWGIVVLLFLERFFYERFYGFQYYASYDKIFNIIPLFFQSFILFLMWVIANWAMCTLFDGEGTVKRIFVNSAYALVPFIVSSFIGIFLSHFLIMEEYVFIQIIGVVGFAWSLLLMISGIKTVHQFGIWKTLSLMLLTLIAMVAMLFLIILLLTLFQQMLIFVLSIYTELSYRIRV
ncbi:MAG: YIP1 family protein [Oscillospiraceae bacterium]|nr:YIP1 family protein [Oscillospiraceae bacterium]